MKKKYLNMKNISLILLILYILSNIVVAHAGSSKKHTFKKKGNKKIYSRSLKKSYVNGQVLVKLKTGKFFTGKKNIKVGNGRYLQLKSLRRNKNVFLMKLKPGISVKRAVKELKKNADVVDAEPNYVRKLSFIPNDPQFSNQWWLNNTGQSVAGIQGLSGADISAPEAWEIEKGLLNPVKVAVVDSGVDSSNPDLSGKVIPGYNWVGISQTYFNSGWSFGDSSKNRGFAQSIKGTGRKLTHIGLALAKEGKPKSAITVAIRSRLNRGNLAYYKISPSKISASESEYYGKLSRPVILKSNTNYFIVAYTNNNDKSNFYYYFDNSDNYIDNIPDPYSLGHEYSWNGRSWTVYSNDDLYFRTNRNSNPVDDVGHGTHVSGIIAANFNNSEGIAGVSPGAVIMPLKVADSSEMLTSEDFISALHYAVDHGAKVINLSFGDSHWSRLEQQAIDYAHNRGAILIAASGNSYGSEVEYPAGYTYVVGVGATDNQDKIADYSTYNSKVDVTAPGTDIISTMPTYNVSLNGYGYSRKYDYVSGTSMATPMVSGLAALVFSRNPYYTPAMVEQAIENNADDKGDPGRDDYYGYGRINAYNTLKSIYPVTVDITGPMIRAVYSTHGLNSYFYRSNNPYFSWDVFDFSGVAGYAYAIDHSSYTNPTYFSTVNSVRFSRLSNGKWYFHLKALDNSGNWSSVKNLLFYIDNVKPKTYAKKRVFVKRNKYTRLYWVVKDRYTRNRAYVTLKIKKGRSTKKTIRLGYTTINRTRYYKYKAALPKGKYYYYVYAKDQAGNSQHNVARNALYIR